MIAVECGCVPLQLTAPEASDPPADAGSPEVSISIKSNPLFQQQQQQQQQSMQQPAEPGSDHLQGDSLAAAAAQALEQSRAGDDTARQMGKDVTTSQSAQPTAAAVLVSHP